MAENSKIEWTDHTLNPWIGCTKVAPGCANCYAEALMDTRWGKAKWGPKGTRVLTSEANWKKPLQWNRLAEKLGVRLKVFCASLADVFEDWDGPIVNHRGESLYRGSYITNATASEVAQAKGYGSDARLLTMNDLRRDLFQLFDHTPNLDWLLLTKRPENVRRMWRGGDVVGDVAACYGDGSGWGVSRSPKYRPNTWLLTSVSDQETADKAIPELLKCRDMVPVLGLSVEPLLGPIDFTCLKVDRDIECNTLIGEYRQFCDEGVDHPAAEQFFEGGPKVDWVIIGVESNGKNVGRLGADRTEAEWIDDAVDLVNQCRSAGVAVFVKQVPINGRVSHNPDEWPEELRVREFPEVPHD